MIDTLMSDYITLYIIYIIGKLRYVSIDADGIWNENTRACGSKRQQALHLVYRLPIFV